MKPRPAKTSSSHSVSAVYRLRIARSRIHRWGVFAVGTIPRGRKVIEYTGERISPTEACARVNRLLEPGRPKRTYLFRLNRLWTIDGAVGGSGAERINHSCNPNLFYRRTRGHILLFSLRRIHPGEELSYDYRLVSNSLRVPCRCGSPNCRGFLNRD